LKWEPEVLFTTCSYRLVSCVYLVEFLFLLTVEAGDSVPLINQAINRDDMIITVV